MSDLAAIETPALLACRPRIERNAERMRKKAEQHDVTLRPHLKTAKSADIARIAHGGETGPGTVSTLAEADYFLEHGFADLTYAVSITPNKLDHVDALLERGARLRLLVSGEGGAAAFAAAVAANGRRYEVMLEVDCGDHRTGMAPGDAELLKAARTLHAAADIDLVGLLTHGGHSYGCRTANAIAKVADDERNALLAAQAELRSAGIDAACLSSGSTPTAVLGNNYDGLTELRPGVYLVGDLFQMQLGVCHFEDIAVSVLATIIAVDPARNRLVIDAGALALSKDRSTADAPVDFGFGMVVDEFGRAPGMLMTVVGVSQEHGVVTADGDIDYGRWAVGGRVRVLPNHACMTAASYDRYLVTDEDGATIVDEWHKASGW